MIRPGYMVRATALDDRVRAFSIDSTPVVAELHRRHGTDPAPTAALGRTATAALLLAAMLKKADQSVSLRIQGDGPGGTLLATANAAGDVRGLIANPRPDVEQVRDGKLNVSGVVGTRGRLGVMRDLGLRHPYSSSVEIVSGEVGEDIAYYLAQSEQVPSAVGIGVFVRADGSVEAAGGYIVQLLPGLAEEDVASIERTIRELPHPTRMLRDGDSPEQMLRRIFDDRFAVLDRTAVRFRCPCSRERAERALIALGHEELRSITDEAAERGFTDLTCEFCAEAYRFEPAALETLIRGAS